MKKPHFLALLVFLSTSTFATCNQDSYYSGLNTNATGYEFKSKLSNLLGKTHRSLSYGDLLGAYRKTDRDTTYDADNTILDMYSERPEGRDPYRYTTSRTCGQYRNEGDCYNREHLFPQGLFDKKRPMKSDIFHIYPTDGKVNGMRGSYPFGEVSSTNWSSENGSKLGPSSDPRYRGLVFEPIDEFKGDIARAMLYFAVRYERQIPGFKDSPMTNGSYEQTYSTWFLQTLMKWHKQDPVSEHERFRNNAACNYQKNRNPFIDHPEWAMAIWEVN
ncbi:endonuclease [Halobacteriovorax sp. JY17]|uniref:HNH endonuclease signature motif containing protein n=1 Tax=Halobacteriovorax sp. JY17 TaxID=2014617 RepID=UPI000C42B97D|nr:endonuclease [Halobacteriovorax sp. JY17]PIK13559.1 MAG: endonuclease I [Halobacteriovorax sp. JY17]